MHPQPLIAPLDAGPPRLMAAVRAHARRAAGGLAVTLLCLTQAVAADDPGPRLSPEAFESFASGHTLTFNLGGAPYGVEQYLPGRRVIWAFIGGPCREGTWFPAGDRVCFEYDDEPGRLHCWTFYDTADGMVARSAGMGQGDVVSVERTSEPMSCPGPEVGV